MTEPTQRFSGRADDYAEHRPSYPPEVVGLLERECGLGPGSVVADVGSGTGILSRLFLDYGCRVCGVEPNDEMREVGERRLRGYPNFTSVAGTAESTSLPDGSVDFVTAGQSFHWFDPEPARQEFARILKPGGWVVLVWNWRKTDAAPLLAAYESLLQRYGTDYQRVTHTRLDRKGISSFFGHEDFGTGTFENEQYLDHEGLKGRILSTSCMPGVGHPDHETVLEKIEAIFREHQQDGTVRMDYETRVFYGQL